MLNLPSTLPARVVAFPPFTLAAGTYRPTLAIGTRRIGAGVLVQVRDRGTGIPLSLPDQIFRSFFTPSRPAKTLA